MICALFASYAASAQCTYTLEGFDSFGDGWNGGSVTITDNGVPVTGSPFAAAGNGQTWTFTVTNGNNLQLDWTAGGFLGEVSFNLLDDTGTAVFSQTAPAPATTVALYTQTITCTPCATVPDGLLTGNFTGNSSDMTWNAVFGANSYDIEWGLAGFTPGTGNAVGSIVGSTNTTETATGLMPNTAYDFYVQSDCGNGWSNAFSWSLPCILTTPAVLPWTEDFEAATTVTQLGDAELECTPSYKWDFVTTDQAQGRARYGTTAIAFLSGTNAVTLDRANTAATSQSQMILTIDLSNYASSPELAMAINWMHHGEEDHAGDRIWARGSDLDPWVEIYNWANIADFGNAGQWFNEPVIDVMTPLTAAGQTVGAGTQFRFGQEDNFPADSPTSTDGWTFDDVSLYTCLPAQNITVTGSDTTSASFTWTSASSEWILEYGPVGFTPGTGDSITTTMNPDTITGLTPNTFYDVYITAICGVGDTALTAGPIFFNTYDQGLYMEANNECPDTGYVDIAATGVLNNLGDDGEVSVTLPFTLLYQGTPVNDITIGSNGGIVMGAGQQVGFGNGAMATAADGLYPFWDDLGPEALPTQGVYYQTFGSAPNQMFVVQWNKPRLGGNGGTYEFQLQIHEATGEVYFVYQVVDVADPANDYGNGATIGVAGPNQDVQVSLNNPTYLQNESCVNFYYTDCARPVNYNTVYTTNNEAAFTWNAGLANETEWLVVYGECGFDPMTGGTSVTVPGPTLTIPGLDDKTDYCVYIMALCANGDTSLALEGTFTTLPNCADPTGLALASAVDSVFLSWDYTNNTGYPIQEFAFQYGPTGFALGNGTTIYGQDTISAPPYLDSIVDPSLMSGGIYDVYVQAICLTGDSSNWATVNQVTMPLTNDTTCMAQAIPVDGVNYSFNGTGATAQLGELGIAPPAGPCDGQMTWCNSSITASTWFTFVAPASGNVRIDGEFQDFDGQAAVYEATDCADFNTYTLLGANDDFNLNGDDFPYLNVCGLTPGNTYYLVHDPNGAAGIYSLRIQEVVVEAGSDNGLLDVCLGDTVNLNTQLTGADAGGTWTESIPTAGFNDPVWISSGLASQVYTFEYSVVDGCAVDSIETSVEIYAPSFAGLDGTINACQNEPVTLWNGLVGSVGVDFTGTWYDPSNNALSSADITADAIPGQYNYDYIAGNGVCPDDTSNITLIVDPSCDYLNLQEVTFASMDLYPNPTTNVFYISNEGATEVYNYELTDLNGKVITAKENAINGVETTEVSVENLETGVYLIRIFNENAEKTFRVVKQ